MNNPNWFRLSTSEFRLFAVASGNKDITSEVVSLWSAHPVETGSFTWIKFLGLSVYKCNLLLTFLSDVRDRFVVRSSSFSRQLLKLTYLPGKIKKIDIVIKLLKIKLNTKPRLHGMVQCLVHLPYISVPKVRLLWTRKNAQVV